jgi:hypothetical protein
MSKVKRAGYGQGERFGDPLNKKEWVIKKIPLLKRGIKRFGLRFQMGRRKPPALLSYAFCGLPFACAFS